MLLFLNICRQEALSHPLETIPEKQNPASAEKTVWSVLALCYVKRGTVKLNMVVEY